MKHITAALAITTTTCLFGCSVHIHVPPEPVGVVMILPENTGGPTGYFDANKLMWAYYFSDACKETRNHLKQKRQQAKEAGNTQLANNISTQAMLMDSGMLGPAFGVNTRYHLLLEIDDELRTIAHDRGLGSIILFGKNRDIQTDGEGAEFVDITDDLVAAIDEPIG